MNDDEADRLGDEILNWEYQGESIDEVTGSIINGLREDEALKKSENSETAEGADDLEEEGSIIGYIEAMEHIDRLIKYSTVNAPDGFVYLQEFKTVVEKQAYAATQKKKKQTNMMDYFNVSTENSAK